MNKINDLIRGFLLSGADEGVVSVSDAADRAGMTSDLASRQTRFLCDSGILIKEGMKFRLTEDGVNYARFVDWNQDESAKKILSDILSRYELATKIVHFIRVTGPVSRDDLIRRVGVLSNVPSTPMHATGAGAFIDMLLFSGMIEEKDKNLYIVGQQQQTGDRPLAVTQVTKSRDTSLLELEEPRGQRFSINITLNVDSQITSTRLRELIRIVKEELQEPNIKVEESNEE